MAESTIGVPQWLAEVSPEWSQQYESALESHLIHQEPAWSMSHRVSRFQVS